MSPKTWHCTGQHCFNIGLHKGQVRLAVVWEREGGGPENIICLLIEHILIALPS